MAFAPYGVASISPFWWPSTVQALSVGYNGTVTPFNIELAESQFPKELSLQVLNDNATTDTLLSWQLDLKLIALGSARGILAVTNVSAPQDSLFGPDPGPSYLEQLPAAQIHAFDADYSGSFAGVAVSGGSARNILELEISASNGIAGDFQLVMVDFNSNNSDDGSSWFPADSPDPIAFGNSASSDLPGTRLLGTFHISSLIPGDYDGDGSVAQSDYDVWRSLFGVAEEVPGSEADGNRNGVVDAADYVLWRQQITQLNHGTLASENTPEPTTGLLTIAMMSLSPILLARNLTFRTI